MVADYNVKNNDAINGHQMDLSCIVSAWKKIRKRPRKCMCPCCYEQDVIDSHSITQNHCLKAIAEDGWIYQPQFRDVGKIFRRAYSHNVILPSIEKIEISRASVFNWYCAKHDNELFKHIDVAQLEHNNPQQARELYLRAMSRNIANLEDGVLCIEEFDKLRNTAIGKSSFAVSRSRLAYDSDMDHLWNSYWSTCIPNVINWYWRVVSGNLGVAVSAMFPMAGEGNAEEWYRFCGARPMVSLSVIPQSNNITHVVFAWWYEWDEMMREIKSILEGKSDEDFLYGVNRIIVTELDGFCISPRIWTSLTKSEHLALEYFQQGEDCHAPNVSIPQLISKRNYKIMEALKR
jgi:hypothetical protein